jgi:hypothetical protein
LQSIEKKYKKDQKKKSIKSNVETTIKDIENHCTNTHTTTTDGLGRGFEPTSVESYLQQAATHQGQIYNERVREEIRSRDLGFGGCLYLVYYISIIE